MEKTLKDFVAEKPPLRKAGPPQRRPIEIYEPSEIEAFRKSSKEVQDLWDAYAQRAADEYNAHCDLDRTTNVLANWKPPLKFSVWKKLLLEKI